jgi:UDP-3-O-[3-hydroxymyristoyl] glucosamine N-acyltransferase
MTEAPASTIHPTADVAESAKIGVGTRVWHQAQVREGAVIGRNCILGKGVFVDANVRIGNRCKLENGASVFQGFSLDDEVFVGPGTMLLERPLAPRDQSGRFIEITG